MAFIIGGFATITINSASIYRPNELQLEREDVYAGEYVTCTGKIIADVIGWKYSDMEMEWDTLPASQMAVLTGLSGVNTLTFTDSSGSHTENFVRLGFTEAPTRFTGYDGQPVWKNVKLKVRFVDVHSYE